MILEWDSGTQPHVVFSCFSQLGNQTGWVVAQKQNSPAAYKMTDTAISQGANDLTFCHYYFDPSAHGNTVVFQFDNRPSAKPFTWSRSSVASSSSSSSSSTSASTATSSATTSSSTTSKPSSTPSQSANNDSSSGGGGGLSAGASAGIGIGVAAVVIFAAVAIFLMMRRRKTSNKQSAAMDSQGPYEMPPEQQRHQQMQQGHMSPMSGDGSASYYSHNQGYPVAMYQDTAYKKNASPPAPAELASPYRPTELP